VRRKNLMSEPTSLDPLIIPEELKYTLNGELFLINESEIGNDNILLFTTLMNLRSPNWQNTGLWTERLKQSQRYSTSYIQFMLQLDMIQSCEFYLGFLLS